MPRMFEFSPYAIHNDEPSLTEQEHINSCDANKMIKAAMNGQTFRGTTSEPQYGYDDTTLDAVQYRIQKEALEKELNDISSTHEFEPQELNYIPDPVKKRFKFKQKNKQMELKPNEQNDKTKAPTTAEPKTEPPTSQPLP